MRPRASPVPTTACAVGSAMISIPAAAMHAPPMPTSLTPGCISASARQSVAPWRSPEASPADSMMDTRSDRVIEARHRDPGLVGQPDHLVAVHHQHLPAVDAERGGAAVCHRLERRGPYCWNVEAVILGGPDGLHHDRAPPGQAGAATDRLV